MQNTFGLTGLFLVVIQVVITGFFMFSMRLTFERSKRSIFTAFFIGVVYIFLTILFVYLYPKIADYYGKLVLLNIILFGFVIAISSSIMMTKSKLPWIGLALGSIVGFLWAFLSKDYEFIPWTTGVLGIFGLIYNLVISYKGKTDSGIKKKYPWWMDEDGNIKV